jgi:hypothetical protein
MTQISHDAGQLRKPDGAWQVTNAESVLFVPNEGTSLEAVVIWFVTDSAVRNRGWRNQGHQQTNSQTTTM